MLNPIAAWILAMMVTLLSPEKGATTPTTRDNRETVEARAERYDGIADAIASVSFDPDEEPLFTGDDGRAKTAALLVAISFYESGGWNRVVDFGIGPRGRGDSGTSHCLAQVRLSPGMRTRHGYSAEDLTADRRACFRAALALARDSFRSCGHVPAADRLAVYASGRCGAGLRQSRTRWQTAHRLFAAVPPPAPDADFVNMVALP